MKLESGAANNSYFFLARLGFEVEEITKEIKMGSNVGKRVGYFSITTAYTQNTCE